MRCHAGSAMRKKEGQPTIDSLLEASNWEERLAEARARREKALAARSSAPATLAKEAADTTPDKDNFAPQTVETEAHPQAAKPAPRRFLVAAVTVGLLIGAAAGGLGVWFAQNGAGPLGQSQPVSLPSGASGETTEVETVAARTVDITREEPGEVLGLTRPRARSDLTASTPEAETLSVPPQQPGQLVEGPQFDEPALAALQPTRPQQMRQVDRLRAGTAPSMNDQPGMLIIEDATTAPRAPFPQASLPEPPMELPQSAAAPPAPSAPIDRHAGVDKLTPLMPEASVQLLAPQQPEQSVEQPSIEPATTVRQLTPPQQADSVQRLETADAPAMNDQPGAFNIEARSAAPPAPRAEIGLPERGLELEQRAALPPPRGAPIDKQATVPRLSRPSGQDAAPEIPASPLPALSNVRIFVSEAGSKDDRANLTELLQDAGVQAPAPVPLAFAAPETEVRYYTPDDAAAARRIAKPLGATARDFTRYRPKPPEGTIDVYLSD